MAENLKISGATAGNGKTISFKKAGRGREFRKIEACYSSLEAAKAFVLSTPYEIIKTGEKEADDYVENLIRINDLKSMNFMLFMKNVLEFIHYGISCTAVEWKKDATGFMFPASCVKINPERVLYEDGKFLDRYNENKEFDPARFYFAYEAMTDEGFETGLLDAIEPICKIIIESNKTLPPAIRKYKNQPKVAVVTGTGDIVRDNENTSIVSSLLAGMDEKSTVAVTALEKLIPGIIADIEKVQSVQDKQELKILRAYIGHSELLAGSSSGNNTKMIMIKKISDEYKRFRVAAVEKAVNELLTNLVHHRFGYDWAVPYLRFKIDTDSKDLETENLTGIENV